MAGAWTPTMALAIVLLGSAVTVLAWRGKGGGKRPPNPNGPWRRYS